MKHGNLVKLALIILSASVLTIDVGISAVNAIWPFDQLMSPTTNQTTNQSSASSLTNESGEDDNESESESEGEKDD